MNALKSAGEFERASTPCRSSCSFIDAVDNARTISRLMAATIGAGVWAGATIPHHEVALNPGAVSAIAGRFGIDDDRVGLVTAIARRRFDLMCGTTARALAKLIAIWPPIRSTMAGPVPLYGTCTISMPNVVPNMTPARCCELPMPFDPYVSLPGRAFGERYELG